MSGKGEDVSMSRKGEDIIITEEEEDELYQLVQKALYVEPPTRVIDLDTEPRDGSEFIHRSRLEDAKLDFSRLENIIEQTEEENEQKRTRQWAREKAAEFCHHALSLTSEKTRIYLKKKFPKWLEFPKNGPDNIQKWCTFCLGSKLCSEIYGDEYEGSCEEIEANLPFLSIVMHFKPYTAFTVLKNLHEWFLSIGMEKSLGRWVYAVCSCVKKPIDDRFKKLIKTFYSDCQKRLKDCDESERLRLYLISAIMESYFCVNLDKVGFSLECFLNMKH